ncbi:MAG: hypothetical protein IEMM0008_1906 [bacterium]|nr:MAG: hypothetical protein IEMM0008_1906 [bacterium]
MIQIATESMTLFRPGDILLIDLPFTDDTASKQRPVLVLIDEKDDDLVLSRITTVYRSNQPYDYEIKDLNPTGLITKSYIRLTKVFTLEKTKVKATLGHLSHSDKVTVNALIHKLYTLNP